MRDLDLISLRLFVAVCDTGNMSRAGERAGMVASAVSKRLAQLEETVGTALLVRKRHGVGLTPAGEALLDHARSMLLAASRIERDMALIAAGGQGRVNLLATSAIMAEGLIDDIAAYLKRPENRQLEIDVEEHSSPMVTRGVREGAAAIGVCWDAAVNGVLHMRTYRYDHLGMAVPRGHPLARRKALRYADTLEYEQVSMPVNSAIEVLLDREASLAGKRLRRRVIVTNYEASLRVVRAGLALAVVPIEVTGRYVDTAGLNIVPLRDAWARRRFVLCHRGEHTLTPAAVRLLDALTAQEP